MSNLFSSLAETQRFAAEVTRSLVPNQKEATVVALSGDLGAGKTAFAKAIARELGVVEQVTSPTFVIQKSYPLDSARFGFEQLVHIDAYRLEKSSELVKLGWTELINNPKNLILIEWPEKVADLIPASAQKLTFQFVDETTRDIS